MGAHKKWIIMHIVRTTKAYNFEHEKCTPIVIPAKNIPKENKKHVT